MNTFSVAGYYNMKEKGFGKTIIISLAIIVSGTFLFNGILEGVFANEVTKTEIVPTSYSILTDNKSPIKESYYKEASYTIEMDSNSNIPTTTDMSKEDAVEFGAKWIWQVFEANLNNAIIYMSYRAGTTERPRGTWKGDVCLSTADEGIPLVDYTFEIDSITGELLDIHPADRYLDVKLPILPENLRKYESGEFSPSVTKEDLPFLPDPALYEDATEYEALARQIAEKSNLFDGVKSVGKETGKDIVQGVDPSQNEAFIVIPVKGNNGKNASFKFSRYDKRFMGLMIEPSYITPLEL